MSTVSASSPEQLHSNSYAQPEVAVSTAWVADRMNDPNVKHLLGVEDAKNYDGSSIELGSLVGAPIETGESQPPLPKVACR